MPALWIFFLLCWVIHPSVILAGKNMQDAPCLKTWHIERHDSPWAGITSAEALYTIRAVKKRPAGKNRIVQPAGLATGDFVLFRSERSDAVVVNARYFSDLARQDATGKALRDGGVLGFATPAALQLWSGQALLDFLLTQQVILTYVHIEAKICLLREKEEGNVYQAELSGEHAYYTSRRNVEQFAFLFELDKTTGKMRVMNIPIP